MNYRYVVQELRHHRHRTLVNVMGIAVGIALFVAINSVSSAYQEAVSLPFKSLGTDMIVQRPEKRASDSTQSAAVMRGIRLPFSNQLLSKEDLAQIQAIEAIDSYATSLLLWEFGKTGFRTIMGVDSSQPSLGPVKATEWIKEGRFPRKGEILVEKHYAKFAHTKMGDSIEIGGHSYKIVGLLEIREGAQAASANMYLPISEARDLIGTGADSANVVFLRLKNPIAARAGQGGSFQKAQRRFRYEFRFFHGVDGGDFKDLRSVFLPGIHCRVRRGGFSHC
jgi:putative ABC transport system permease protein